LENSLLQWDKSALLWINSHHSPLLDYLLLPISYVGEVSAIWITLCLGLLIFGKPADRKTALLLGLTMLAVDRLIAAPLGHAFFRERPYLVLEGIRQMGIRWTGGSFPSGHAHAVWLTTVILGNRWRKLLPYLIVFAVLTCYSRPYFGMHYPLDVIAGALIGASAGFLVLGAGRLLRHIFRAKTNELNP
jgi:undecaprenyl-diphosphatase